MSEKWVLRVCESCGQPVRLTDGCWPHGPAKDHSGPFSDHRYEFVALDRTYGESTERERAA